MNLRDYLEQRERELLDELGPLYSEVKQREAELADIRRAKVSIGMSPPWRAEEGLGRFASVDGLARGLATPFVDVSPGVLVRAVDTAETPLPLRSPYAHLTMKQLVVKALDEYFNLGATTREMTDFFRDAWGRNIERTSLSPQLSRLYQEGIIGRGEGSKAWYLLPEERRGRRPYRVLMPVVDTDEQGYVVKTIHEVGDIVYLRPDEVENDVYAPAWNDLVPGPDPHDDD